MRVIIAVVGLAYPLLIYAGLVLLYFGHAWVARGVPDVERKHTVYFLAGLFTLWLALETPLDTISDYYLDSVHMLQHVLLAFVAPPLMLLGLSPGMVARLVRVPGVRQLTEPVPAQVIAAAVMIAWHLPPLYDATLANEGLHVFEHLTFIAGGLVLYWPSSKPRPRTPAGACRPAPGLSTSCSPPCPRTASPWP